MRVVVPQEARAAERRVALVPDAVRKLVAAGLQVTVESGAGRHARVSDADFLAAGAQIAPAVDDAEGSLDPVEAADVVVSVGPLAVPRAGRLRPGVVTISFLPADRGPLLEVLGQRGVTALAMERVPRISRAQSMDALTSQALVAGYRAALVAADRLPRFFPLFMTAAGTMAPAKVLVLGAGVAGLQAIATARRLGAVVSAYDVRPSSADEVRSMGAIFLDLGLEAIEGPGGYARELTAERSAHQRELLAPHVAAADALITTAAVPERRAPLLVTLDMVAAMRPGSVVVDLAAETGGNVEGSRPGEEYEVGGVLIWGGADVASQLPVHASALYARNVANLLLLMTTDGDVVPDFADEIVAGCVVVRPPEPLVSRADPAGGGA
jgi:NAD(P) transhydrogenase subunit alpha